MNVNKDNFEVALAEIEALLPTCSFVSFDEEMTGIHLSKDTNESIDDSVPQRYSKMRQVASTFNLIQVGICLFHPDPAHPDSGLIARPYNFFVFPDDGPPGYNPTVFMQASGIAFNRKHNMDFNHWIYKGVSYMPADAEETLHRILFGESEQPAYKKRKIVLTKDADLVAVNGALDAVKQWLAEATPESKEFVLPELNSFLRAAIYQRLESEHPELVCETRSVGGDRFRSSVVVMRMTAEEKVAREKRIFDEKMDQFNRRVGFRRLFKALARAKKPMVGHNCLFDLLFLYSHFEGRLPDTLAEFKAALGGLFLELYDTKLIATAGAFIKDKPIWKSTALGDLYKAVSLPDWASTASISVAASDSMQLDDPTPAPTAAAVPIKMADGFERYVTADSGSERPAVAVGGEGTAMPENPFHEAGFDAYATGCVFARLRGHVALEEYRNRLNLLKSLFGFNLAGEDRIAEKGLIYHLSEFPKEIANQDILEMFGRDVGTVTIKWIDDTSMFVIVRDNSKEELVTERVKSASETMKVKSLEEYLQGISANR